MLNDEMKMSDDESSVNIEKIMNEIKIQAAQLEKEDLPKFDDMEFPYEVTQNISIDEQIKNEVMYLKNNNKIPYSFEMGKGIKLFIKRVIKKLLNFLILPIVEHQNEYNHHVANAIDALRIENTLLKKENNRNIDDILMKLLRQSESSQREINADQQLYEENPKSSSQHNNMHECSEKNIDPYSQLDYFEFQNEFRGTQNDIMQNQRVYLQYFKGKKGRIFDIGCGRGEFLRLLKEKNIDAFGIDTFEQYKKLGEFHGIDIIIGDGIEYLNDTEEIFGGIFCAQVIEHIGIENIIKLCNLAYKKLENGGCLVLETPNPTCISTMTSAFYIDPTHDKPIHPLLLQYIVKKAGFSDCQIIYPDHSQMPLPLIISEKIENIEEVNNAICRISNLLYGSQDYAIIANK